MTKKELQQIYYLNREIKMWQDELNEPKYDLSLQSPITKRHGSGSKSISNKTAEIVEKIEEEKVQINAIIAGKLLEIQIQRKRIMEFIDSIDDSVMRQIIQYRHVSCMKWVEVASHIGGNNTADGVRVAHDDFLKNKT